MGVVAALSLLAPIGAAGATTTVYKCLDRNLGLVYTDEPCKDGERLDIRAGDADPAALARLDRARDALERSAEQRIADERRFAAQRDLAAWMSYTGLEPPAYDDTVPPSAYDYAWMSGFPSFVQPHPRRSKFPRAEGPRRSAPRPPFSVPRS